MAAVGGRTNLLISGDMSWFSFHGGHSGSFCRHAKDDLVDVVERAIALGVTHYGLSEHAPDPDITAAILL
jgi:histidinol phosphatase-like PHP family hydrolase